MQDILVAISYFICGSLLTGAIYSAAIAWDEIISSYRERNAAQPYEAEKEE